jgi:hypothetical protein
MSVDDLNEKQNKAMADLRERIEARKHASEQANLEQNALFPAFVPPKREIKPLPEITAPVGQFAEFSYERFIQVQERLDVAYANYLWWLEGTDFQLVAEAKAKGNSLDGFEDSLKKLIQTVDLYVAESLRPRY